MCFTIILEQKDSFTRGNGNILIQVSCPDEGLLKRLTTVENDDEMKPPDVQSIPVFVYGTLMNPAVLQTLLGRNLAPMEEARITGGRLEGFARHPVKGEVFPAIIPSSLLPSPSSQVQGLLLPSFAPLEMSLLDWFESETYERKLVQVFPLTGTNSEEVPIDAQAYIWRDDLISQLDRSKEWSYENFCDSHLEWYLRRTVRPCRAEMERLGMTIQ
jgi:hypothetical protein